jgi:hypothetical protein
MTAIKSVHPLTNNQSANQPVISQSIISQPVNPSTTLPEAR